jgi:hypothetical protein
LRIFHPVQALFDDLVSGLALPCKLDGYSALFFSLGGAITRTRIKDNRQAMTSASAVAAQIFY